MDLQPQITNVLDSVDRLRETLFSLCCLQAFQGKKIEETRGLIHIYEPDEEIGLVRYSSNNRSRPPTELYIGDTFDRIPKVDGYIVEGYKMTTIESIHDDHCFDESFARWRIFEAPDLLTVRYDFLRVGKTRGPVSIFLNGLAMAKVETREMRL